MEERPHPFAMPAAAYQLLFDRNPMPMLLVDQQSLRLLDANQAAVDCYGYTVAQLVAMYLPDLYFPEDLVALKAYMAQDTASRAGSTRWRHVVQDGSAIEVEMFTEDLYHDGTVFHMLLVRNITLDHENKKARDSLTHQLKETLEHITDGFFSLDHEARFTYVNAHAERLMQTPREKLLGRVIWECFPEALGTEYKAHYQALVQGETATRFEVHFKAWNVWHDVRAFRTPQGVTAYFRDVTRWHLDSLLLTQERERLEAIVNASSEAIITTNVDGMVQTFNPGAERVFGFSRAQMLGQSIHKLLPQRYRSAHVQQHRQFGGSGEPPRMMGLRQVKGLRSDGQEVDLEGSIAQVSIDGGKVLIAALRDVTARNLADAERQAARVQLSDLTHRLMSQEKELVKRIAQALHDQLGQTTAAIRIVHETMGLMRPAKVSGEYKKLDLQMGKLIDQATRQIRMVLVDLHPPLLDEQGLAAALDNELRSRAAALERMNFILNVPSSVANLRWPAAVEYATFMIAREAIENTLRHANATLLTLNLSGTAQSIELDVIDNGHGFDKPEVPRVGHLGITGMLERARSMGGEVSVSPAAGGGTTVSIRWKATP